MLDHQAVRRVRQGAYAACALIAFAAATAGAQLPIVTPPAVAPSAPGSSSVTYGGDAARRNAWAGINVAPPLGALWTIDAAPVTAPIVAGKTVVVETAAALSGHALGTGAQTWTVPLSRPVELATDGSRVYAAGTTGVIALDAATGAPAWTAPGAATGPVVADGRVIVGTATGAAAFEAGTGLPLWSADAGIAGGRPAVAGSRAFVTGRCRAAAIATTTGLPIWTTGDCTGDTGTQTLLNGLAVFAEGAAIYKAEDGTVLSPGPSPGTIGAGLVLGISSGTLVARDGAFAQRWTWSPPISGHVALRPAVTDGTVWQVADAGTQGLVLGAIDAATGAERWTGFLPGTGTFQPSAYAAVAAIPGGLLVPTAGGKLTALVGVAAKPLGITATLPANVVPAGARTTITGHLTSSNGALIGPRTVTLEADRFPFDDRYRKLKATIAGRDGFRFGTGVPRNTRFRLAADGVTYPPTAVYATPKLSVVYHRTKQRLVVRAKLKIAAIKGLQRGGGKVGVYRRKPGADVVTRLGAGRSNQHGVARFRVRIPLSLDRDDQILTCLRGASRQGFGYPDVLDVHCGAKRIAIPVTASRLHPARIHGENALFALAH
jgi:hypothetical protein